MSLDTNIQFHKFNNGTNFTTSYGMCQNPVYNDKKLDSFENKNVRKVDNKSLFLKFKKLYAICLKPFSNFKEEIYETQISRSFEQYIYENYILFEIPIYLIKTDEIKNNTVLLSNKSISNMNHIGYELADFNLCVQFLNLKLDNVKLFITQFRPEYKLSDYFKLKLMNSFFSVNENYYVYSKALKILQNIDGHSFWSNPSNCNLNQTISFCEREFKYNIHKLADEDAKKIVQKLKDNPADKNNYLSFIFDKKA